MNSQKVIIITSAAYLDAQLEVEFGRIPPSFLPLGGARLYEHHYRLFHKLNARIILTIPQDFILPQYDQKNLNLLHLEIVRIPIGLSLGQSIIYAINITATSSNPLSILHGDTLIDDINFSLENSVSIGRVESNYNWGLVTTNKGFLGDKTELSSLDSSKSKFALTGWFSFSNCSQLIQSITLEDSNFLKGIIRYGKANPLKTEISNQWFDFGHADTFYQSRKKITTQRSFNNLLFSKRSVKKNGSNKSKIQSEINWFNELPMPLKIYTPTLLSYDLNKINQIKNPQCNN
jgi:hypothetical protein